MKKIKYKVLQRNEYKNTSKKKHNKKYETPKI